MKTTTQQAMIIELTHPVSAWIQSAFHAVQDHITQLQVNRLKKQVLHRHLEGLTDPTFLDRATAGDDSE